MYSVSNAYKTAIANNVREYRLKIITDDHTYEEEDIQQGAFYVTNQCSDETQFQIGQVFIGELGVVIMNSNIGRYDWHGKELMPYFGLRLANTSVEYVPLGKFTVKKAEWNEAGVKLTAYDLMDRFEKDCSFSVMHTKLYDMAVLACNVCGVQLGTTAAQFSNFANASEYFDTYENSDITTWRDLLYWIAQTSATFATMGRDGKLYFRTFGTSAVDTIDNTGRYMGGSFSGFETRYTGISVVDAKSEYTRYYAMPTDNGLTYNLGTNPFLQFDVESDRERCARAILSKMQNIRYEPFNITAKCNPAYDLGDVLRFTDGLADDNALCFISKFTLNFHGAYEMSGSGEDPALATGNSKTDKNISGLISRVEYLESIERNTERRYYNYISTAAIQASDGGSQVKIADIDYKANQGARIEFQFEMKMSVSTTETLANNVYTEHDAVVTVSYKDIGAWRTDYYPIDTFYDGTNLLSLKYSFFAPAYSSEDRNFQAFIAVSGAGISVATGDARGYVFVTEEPEEQNPLEEIEVITPPTKTSYFVGENLDYSGLVVAAIYADGSRVDITNDCTYSPANYTTTTTAGDITVNVNYIADDGQTYTTDFDMEVEPVMVVELEVIQMPTKTLYVIGDNLDYTGLVVKAYFNNGTNGVVTDDCTYSPSNGDTVSDADDITVSVSYTDSGGETAETEFELDYDYITGIEITNLPNVYDYHVTEEETAATDYTGIVVMAYRESGASFDVTNSCTYDPGNGTTLDDSDEGVIEVTVTYECDEGEFDDSFNINVNTFEEGDPDEEEGQGGDPKGEIAQIVVGSEFKNLLHDVVDTNTVFAITKSNNPHPVLSGLKVVKKPNKVKYSKGETADYTGLQVHATFQNHAAVDVTKQCTMNPAEGAELNSTGTIKVLIKYVYGNATKGGSFNITVK